MSMSMRVVGIRKADDKLKSMKAVCDSCRAAGVSVPDEVMEYFNYEKPDERGVILDMEDMSGCVSKWSDGEESGFEVNLANLPSDLTHIRFYCSW